MGVTRVQVRWTTAFLDTPRGWPGQAAAVDFWQKVTATRLSARPGQRQPFAALLPSSGDAFLGAQEIGTGEPGCHLDLHVDDVHAAANEARAVGADPVGALDDAVLLRSPAGFSFCVVSHKGEERRPQPVTWSAAPVSARIASLVDQLCIDVPADAFEPEVAWWAQLLGWVRRAGARPEFAVLARPAGQPLRLMLQRRGPDDPARAATAHLDIACTDRPAEVTRHLGLGARHVRRAARWDTLLDPAGRAYCITDRDPATGLLPTS